MTSDTFRELALRLPGAEERAHMGHPDFRVGGRVFATLGHPRPGWAMVKLTPDAQTTFVRSQPKAFVAVKGAWGERGCTHVLLARATVASVRAALSMAHEATAGRGRTGGRRSRPPRA